MDEKQGVNQFITTSIWDKLDASAVTGDAGKKRFALLGRLLPWALLLFGYIRMILYMANHWKDLINSDLAAEMMLGNLLNQTGAIITKEWLYSTELRVVNTQLVYRLGLTLFPESWHDARVFSVAVLLLILIVCYLLFFKVAGLGQLGVWATAILICPFGRWYTVNVLLGCYYVPHIVLCVLSISLLLLYCKTERVLTRRIMLAALGALCLAAGLGGIRHVQICCVPVFAASLLQDSLYFLKRVARVPRSPEDDVFTLRHNIGSVVILVFGTAGYLINALILSKQYHFSNFGGVTWNMFSLTKLLNALSDFLMSFGFFVNAAVISLDGISCIIGLLVGALVLIFTVQLQKNREGLALSQKYLVDVFSAMMAVTAVCLSQLYIGVHISYWLPVLPFAFLLLFLAIRHGFPTPLLQNTAAVFLAAGMLLCSYSTLREPADLFDGSNAQLAVVADWLIDNGYTQGYATFWNADAMVEYSNGEIEVWTVKFDEQEPGTLYLYDWLQEASHLTDYPKENAFILLSENELKNGSGLALWKGTDGFSLLYDDGTYMICTIKNPIVRVDA